jgi:hypothetical protein
VKNGLAAAAVGFLSWHAEQSDSEILELTNIKAAQKEKLAKTKRK